MTEWTNSSNWSARPQVLFLTWGFPLSIFFSLLKFSFSLAFLPSPISFLNSIFIYYNIFLIPLKFCVLVFILLSILVCFELLDLIYLLFWSYCLLGHRSWCLREHCYGNLHFKRRHIVLFLLCVSPLGPSHPKLGHWQCFLIWISGLIFAVRVFESLFAVFFFL